MHACAAYCGNQPVAAPKRPWQPTPPRAWPASSWCACVCIALCVCAEVCGVVCEANGLTKRSTQEEEERSVMHT